MRDFQVTGPDGRRYQISAPEDTPMPEIERLAREAAGVTDSYPVQQGPEVSSPAPTPSVLENPAGYAQSQMQGASEGFVQPFNNLAAWAEGGLDSLGGMFGNPSLGQDINRLGEGIGLPGTVQESIAAQNAANQAAPYQGGALGRFAGEMVGTALASRLPGGALSKGAQGGALVSQNPTDGFGVARDALLGGAFGKAGDAAFRAGAQIAAPAVNSTLRTLIDAGVRVTPGQYGRAVGGRAGNAIARTEDRAVSAPFLGDTIVEARNSTLDDFARSTVNRAVEPLGLKLPDSVPVGRAAVKWAGDKLSDAYKALEPRIRATGDDQFLQDLSAIQQETSSMLPARAKQFESILKGLNRFWENGQVLDGAAFKQVETRLTQNINRYAQSLDADQRQLGDMLESVRDSLYDLAARQNPAAAQDLANLNRGWKSLTQVERASGNSKAAVSPAGYSQAVKQSSDTVRRRGYARGEALNQDLADAASQVLPSEIADSGTAGRIGQQSIVQSLIGLSQVPAYKATQSALPLLTREGATSPGLSRLLRYGAAASPYAAPALISAGEQ